MSNLIEEGLLTFTDASKKLPMRRRGKRPTPSCLYRWYAYGLRGVKLEGLRVGGNICTTLQALERFFTQLAEARGERMPAIRTPIQRERATERAMKELGLTGSTSTPSVRRPARRK